jgi:hypothetical protein
VEHPLCDQIAFGLAPIGHLLLQTRGESKNPAGDKYIEFHAGRDASTGYRSFARKAPASASAAANSLLGGLCARRRGTSPDVLNDLPTAIWLMFEDDYVAAFVGNLSARGDGG